jgi:predicted nucleic acid-binding protein
VLTSETGPRYLSPFVMQEVDHILASRVGLRTALRFAEDVAAGAYELTPFDRKDVAVANEVMRRYADMPVGLADASIVVLAARHGTVRLLTLDEQHFRAIRPLQGGAFIVLPADA